MKPIENIRVRLMMGFAALSPSYVIVAVLLAVLAGYFFVVPVYVHHLERGMNVVLNAPPYTASGPARELHARIPVADLHADSLLWDRDLLESGTRGSVDVPRLIEGNVTLQAFTIVTKSPRNLNIESNADTSDEITLLAIGERWPPRTWFSLTQRALHQAHKLQDFAARSGGRLTVIRGTQDLDDYLERRRTNTQLTAGFLGIEGAHALDGDLDNIDRLYEAGIRMMAPVHFFDNDIGGSAHGLEKGGLTEKGREMIRRMNEKKMIVDLAHASARTIDDVLALSSRPVVVSHTGVKGTCDNNRNLSDEQLRAVAANGGLVGIGFWETATCGNDAASIARAIRHAAGIMGIDHVALGSDYDGAVTVPFDARGLVLVTETLLQDGFGEDEISLVMGGNLVRFLSENLPN